MEPKENPVKDKNADILLDRKEGVLAIKESMLQFRKDSTFVEVEKSPGSLKRDWLKTGISDGSTLKSCRGLSGLIRSKQRKVPELTKRSPGAASAW